MLEPRYLIASFGNPTPYHRSLHSAGHLALESLQEALGDSQPRFSAHRYGSKSCMASISRKYMLLQSPTLMNNTGPWLAKAYKDILGTYNLQPSQLGFVVVHDDLEEELAHVKTRAWKTSHRGHNGVKSTNMSFNSLRFTGHHWSRISVGIGRPEERDPETITNYVLKPMTPYQNKCIRAAGPKVLDCLHQLEERWKESYEKRAASSADP